MKILTIDTGTTNTRATLWEGMRPLSRAHTPIGVSITVRTGRMDSLKEGIREARDQALKKAGVSLSSVKLILASGMITSRLGLYEMPHIPMPAGREDLALAMKRIPTDCFQQEVWFIPGVRGHGDMMRGEETESLALVERLNIKEPHRLALLGSHMKYIEVNQEGRLVSCLSTLSGELFKMISETTLVADSLGEEGPLEEQALFEGADFAQEHGLSRACFVVRAGSVTSHPRSFLLGAVLASDAQTLKRAKHLEHLPWTLAGPSVLRQALSLLLPEHTAFSGDVRVLRDEEQRDLAGYGALLIAQKRGLF